MFYITGISISFFLSALLFGKKKPAVGDSILAVWLLVIGVHLLFFYLKITGTLFDYPAVLGLQLPLPLLHGPFLYIYASALTGHLKKKTWLLHFVPALLCYIYMFDFFLSPAENKIYVFKNNGVGYETFGAIKDAAIIVSGVVYVALTALLLRKHRRDILNHFSYTEKINLDWLRYLLFGIALIWAFVIAGQDDLVFGTAVCFVIFIGYFGQRQVGIFSPNTPAPVMEQPVAGDIVPESDTSAASMPSNDEKEEDDGPSVVETFVKPAVKRKYSKSGLSKEGAAQLHADLKALMDKEQVFKESELTLTDLAKRLGTHPNYLSQIINEKEGKNFYDYINGLRTEEFKKLVAEPNSRKFTLLSLAFECGFNSKSSFNKYFKKVTGLSPSEYLEKMSVEQAA